MNYFLLFIFGIYAILFAVRFLAIREINKSIKKADVVKENSISFLKKIDYPSQIHHLIKRHNLITAGLWIITIVGVIIVVIDNITRF